MIPKNSQQRNRIKYFEPADYTEGSPIDLLVKNIIRKTNIMNNTVKRLITKTLEESFRLSRGIRKDVWSGWTNEWRKNILAVKKVKYLFK